MILPRDTVNVLIKNGQAAGLTGAEVLDGLVKRGYEPEGVNIAAAKQAIAAKEPKQVNFQPENLEKSLAADTSFGARIAEQQVAGGKRVQKGIEAGTEAFQTGVDKIKQGEITQGTDDFLKGAARGGFGTTAGFLQALFAPVTAGFSKVAEAAAPFVPTAITALRELNPNAADIYDSLAPEVKAKLEPNLEMLTQRASEFKQRNPEDAQLFVDIVDTALAAIGGNKPLNATALNTDIKLPKLNIPKVKIPDIGGVLPSATKPIAESTIVQGAVQKAKDIAGNVNRVASRISESSQELAAKAAAIKNAEPAVADAIKVNLDDRIINTVTQADAATKKAYKEVVDIASEAKDTIGMKRQPTIVGGDLAVKQYGFIDKARRAVGKKLSAAVDELSKTVQVPMQEAYSKIENILKNIDVPIVVSEDGVYLDFSKAGFSKAQEGKIKELYNLVTKGGDTLTPVQIYRKDKLFSQLKRESNLADIGDILIPSADGKTVSLFDEFKKVFADTLDANSPKNIRALNKQYRQYVTMTEAIEDTLLKVGGNLENIPLLKTNPAEFAKVNLRRIFGEAGSSPAFEAVADAMDAASRGLGYKGASPKAVAEFAQEMRKLFPEITPKTGFSGGIKASLAGVADTVLKAGAPELIDQQRALINLLKSLAE